MLGQSWTGWDEDGEDAKRVKGDPLISSCPQICLSAAPGCARGRRDGAYGICSPGWKAGGPVGVGCVPGVGCVGAASTAVLWAVPELGAGRAVGLTG